MESSDRIRVYIPDFEAAWLPGTLDHYEDVEGGGRIAHVTIENPDDNAGIVTEERKVDLSQYAALLGASS